MSSIFTFIDGTSCTSNDAILNVSSYNGSKNKLIVSYIRKFSSSFR